MSRDEAYEVARAAHGDSSWLREAVDAVLSADPDVDEDTLIAETSEATGRTQVKGYTREAARQASTGWAAVRRIVVTCSNGPATEGPFVPLAAPLALSSSITPSFAPESEGDALAAAAPLSSPSIIADARTGVERTEIETRHYFWPGGHRLPSRPATPDEIAAHARYAHGASICTEYGCGRLHWIPANERGGQIT